MNTIRSRSWLIPVVAIAVTACFALAGQHFGMFDVDWSLLAGSALLANAPLAIPEQIKLFEAKARKSEDDALEIVSKAIAEGRSLDEHEEEQRKQHLADCKAAKDHLVVLRETERIQLERAKEVTPDAGAPEGAVAPGTSRSNITVRTNLPKGIRWTRFACAMAQAKGNPMMAHEIAKHHFKDTPEVAQALQAAVSLGGTRYLNQKAAVAFGTTTDSTFVGPLVQYNDMESEFVELLRPKQIIGRMTQLNRVPFMMRAARQLTGVSGSFVGEGMPKPVGKQTYDNVTLSFAKVAVIVVLTDEAVRFSSPNAEIKARDDMIKGIATYIDKRFMDPSYSGVANVSPASITNGATRIQSSGTTLAAIDADVRNAMAPFANSDVDPSTAVWVMPANVALRLSMKRTNQDEPAYPGLTMLGGTWYGLPVIVSNAMVTAGSPAELQIALVTQEEVFLADDGGVAIDMSTEAAVQMNDAPSAGAQSLVSLWQNNLVGIRAEQYINWAPRRAGNLGITLIENVNY